MSNRIATEIAEGGVVFRFAPAIVGEYAGGTPYILNLPTGWPGGRPGVAITAISPPSVLETLPLKAAGSGADLGPVTAWSHGAMVGYGVTGLTTAASAARPVQQMEQAFTGFTEWASISIPYTHARNVDPGATGRPLLIEAGQSAVVTKARGKAEAHQRITLLEQRAVLVVSGEPVTPDQLPPPLSSPSVKSVFWQRDIDMKTGAVAPEAGAPAVASVLPLWCSHHEFQNPARPGSERLTGAANERSFRRDAASDEATAMLLASCAIAQADRELLRTWAVIHAQDICSSLDRGTRFNYPQSDGGVFNGYKPLVVFAALLTRDPWLTGWAQRTDWAYEDAVVQYVTPDMLRLFGAGVPGVKAGFLPEDLGIPWWFAGPKAWPNAGTKDYPCRTFWRRGYQQMFHSNMVAAHALSGIYPGFWAMWNNPGVRDYCDRMHYRTLYKGSGPVAHGLSDAGTTNAADKWHVAMFKAYAPAPVWDWPKV